MTNTILLRGLIQKSGLKYQYVAGELSLTRYGLQRKIENDNEFKASEIFKLSKLLGLTEKQHWEIFFAN